MYQSQGEHSSQHIENPLIRVKAWFINDLYTQRLMPD